MPGSRTIHGRSSATRWQRPAARRHTVFFMLVTAYLAAPPPIAAQGANIMHPIDEIESMFRDGEMQVLSATGSRAEGDRTLSAVLAFADGERIRAKWAAASPGGDAFNNRPRYEVAAYELQKLFLEPDAYVVPPTVVRCFPPEWHRAVDPETPATFDDPAVVLVVLQYWLWGVETWDSFDRKRFRADTAYARHVANLNVFTYLIDHRDSNVGNFLISSHLDPRVYSVDNGVSLRSEKSDRGTEWRLMRVDRIPRETAERLRGIRLEHLREALGVVAQFARDATGRVVSVEPTENLDPRRGIRRANGVLQLGLTEGEVRDIFGRIETLVRRLDRGKIEVL